MSKMPETINVDHAFNPELRQAQADMNAYMETLATKPFMDDNNKLHNPENGKFLSEEDARKFYDKGELTETDEYAEMSISELAKLSAQAEVNGDKTTMSSVDDYILDKIDAMKLENEYVENDGSLRDKSEVDNVYDRVMKLRDSYVAKLSGEVNKEEPSIPTPPSLEEALANTTVKQAKYLNHAWEKQTGQYVAPVNPAEQSKSEIVVEDDKNDEVIDLTTDGDEEDADLPPIVFQTEDDNLEPEPIGTSETHSEARNQMVDAPERKKKSWRKRAILGALAIAAVAGGIFAANRLGDDDNSQEAPVTTTTEAPDSGIDIAGAAAEIEDIEEPAEDTNETDASSTNSDEAQAEAVAAVVANYTPEQQAEMSGNAEAVVVAGDVMPWTNVAENAGVANTRATMQAALDSYNLVHTTNFQFGEGDMFWNGDHVMNPAELEVYNKILQQTVAEASK